MSVVVYHCGIAMVAMGWAVFGISERIAALGMIGPEEKLKSITSVVDKEEAG